MICGSSGIANWPSRPGRLDPAVGAAVHKPQFRVGSNLSGVVVRDVTCDADLTTDRLCVHRSPQGDSSLVIQRSRN